MLGDKTAVGCIAVKDMEAAKKFYEGVLGLSPQPGPDTGGIIYKSGSSNVFVYQSAYAGTNQATAVAWGVGEDIQKVVDDLKQKGVTFEHYDNLPNTTVQGDLHIMGELKAAWFKDPDGNILNIVSQM